MKLSRWARTEPCVLNRVVQRYHFASACFQPTPQRGSPLGSTRPPIGGAPPLRQAIYPPPKKPRPPWSKFSPLKSSNAAPPPPPTPKNALTPPATKSPPPAACKK